jgi:hypothetical protein
MLCRSSRLVHDPLEASIMVRLAQNQRRSTERPFASEDRAPRDHAPRRRPSGHSAFFLPGATIPESGIYKVIHENEHRTPHESVLVRGDAFPFCDLCDDRVRFRVVRTAPYIFEDEDFVE